jgi:hypothetical protein
MDDTQSRSGILVGLAAAVGAFGAAAMMSAATAPTARADDFTDVINSIDGDYADGQLAFTAALTDFSSSDFAGGLADLFEGVDDDTLAAPDNLFIGTVEVLTNETVDGSVPFVWTVPSDFSDAVNVAESFVTGGESDFTLAASDFASGDYGAAAYLDAIGLNAITIDPLQELLLGAAASF